MDSLTVFFALLGSALVKALSKHVDEIDTWAQFHKHSTYSFYALRRRMRKKRQSSQQCHLALLGPTSVKAASKTLMKFTPVFH